MRQYMYCEISHFIKWLEMNQYKGRLFYIKLHTINDKNQYTSAINLPCLYWVWIYSEYIMNMFENNYNTTISEIAGVLR